MIVTRPDCYYERNREKMAIKVHIFLDYVILKPSSLEEHIMYSTTPEASRSFL